jgi:hypothetical protein
MSTIMRWRLLLAGLIGLVGTGLILIILLALGLADPPRIGLLRWQASVPDNWPSKNLTQDMSLKLAPTDLPTAFTLELSARNQGQPTSAWGIQLIGQRDVLTILLNNQGYLSVSAEPQPHWQEFLHLRPDTVNTLYLHVETGYKGTLRINEEIAWEGPVAASTWGVISYRQPQLAWEGLALYHE